MFALKPEDFHLILDIYCDSKYDKQSNIENNFELWIQRFIKDRWTKIVQLTLDVVLSKCFKAELIKKKLLTKKHKNFLTEKKLKDALQSSQN
jgi:hypothetical protein